MRKNCWLEMLWEKTLEENPSVTKLSTDKILQFFKEEYGCNTDKSKFLQFKAALMLDEVPSIHEHNVSQELLEAENNAKLYVINEN